MSVSEYTPRPSFSVSVVKGNVGVAYNEKMAQEVAKLLQEQVGSNPEGMPDSIQAYVDVLLDEEMGYCHYLGVTQSASERDVPMFQEYGGLFHNLALVKTLIMALKRKEDMDGHLPPYLYNFLEQLVEAQRKIRDNQAAYIETVGAA